MFESKLVTQCAGERCKTIATQVERKRESYAIVTQTHSGDNKSIAIALIKCATRPVIN